MKLESVDVIEEKMENIYRIVRDEMTELIPYLPNVSKIVLEESNGNRRVNRWFAQTDNIPSILQKFIKPEFFSWIDRAEWDDANYLVRFELESVLGKDLYDAKGTTYFKEVGDGTTELKVTCNVILYPEKIPGVPKLLAKKLKPAIETLLAKILEPNLTSLAKGLQQYYASK